VDAHAAYASGKLDFLALVTEEHDVLALGLGGPVQSVHQALERVDLIGVHAAHERESSAVCEENQAFAEDRRPSSLGEHPVGDLAFAGGEFPGVQLLRNVDAVVAAKLPTKFLHGLKGGWPLFRLDDQGRVDEQPVAVL
jgi:hypothetical protein